MNQSEILESIDILMAEMAAKTTEYSDCVNRGDDAEVQNRILLQLNEIKKQIDELKEQLLVITVVTPTNGHRK